MKKLIKKSIDEIKLSDLQKEEMLYKITNKKQYNFKFLLKYAVAAYIFVICFLIAGSYTQNTNVMRITHANEMIFNNLTYDLVYTNYELGSYLGYAVINDKTYEVYENLLVENSVVLFNEFYEVYLLRED